MTKREVVAMLTEMIRDLEAEANTLYKGWWLGQKLIALKTAIKLLSKNVK